MSEFYDHEYYHDTTESGSVEEPSPNRQTMPGSERRAHKPGKKLSLIKKLGICAAFAAVFGLVAGGVMVFLWKFCVRPLGGVWNVYELLPAFIVASLAIVVVSLATGKPDAEVEAIFDEVERM